jgi:hypothetical protein
MSRLQPPSAARPPGCAALLAAAALLALPPAVRAESSFTTANNGTIDLVQFTVAPTVLGTGTAVAAANTVTARVISSVGAVSLAARTTGPLSNGTQSISFSQVSAAAAVLTSPVALPHPVLGDNVTNTVAIAAANGVVNRDATWSFSYANTAVVQSGTYGGVNANNGRVTYTASTP